MSTTVTPVAKNIVNAFDYFGQLLGLPRLPGESNVSYRARLWDVYVNRAGSNEVGLSNGITRELDLLQYDALTVSTTLTNNPRIIVGDVSLDLYSSWRIDTSYTLAASIDIYSRSSSAYYLTGLVAAINAVAGFSAALKSGVDGHMQSTVLIGRDSRTWEDSEEIKPFKRVKLDNDTVIEGSLKFTSEGDTIYSTEVAAEASVDASGEYWVDYTEGVVLSYDFPSRAIYCRYMYDELPLTLKASPVILHEFGSAEFRDKIFEQVLQPDGTYADGLPTHDAVDYINEALQARGTLWGT